jgi:hypothetical protein
LLSTVTYSVAVADTILENYGTFAHAGPYTIQRTDTAIGENHSVVIEGNGAKFEVIADSSSDAALTLQNGVTLNLGEGGQFVVKNVTGPAIATTSSSDFKNVINLQGGTFDITAGTTAIDGSRNLQLNISTGGSIIGGKAIENLHSFKLENNSASFLGVTGLLDLSSAAQTGKGGVVFSDGATIRLIPLATEKNTGTLGTDYTENGKTYINFGTGTNITYNNQLNIALDVKNLYEDTSPPSSTQWIKLMAGSKAEDLQSLLHLTVEHGTSTLTGWVLDYATDPSAVYAKFLASSVIPVNDTPDITTNCVDRYLFVNPGSSLSVSAGGSIESTGEIPILIDTSKNWENSNIYITLETNDSVAISNMNGIAIGQGAEGGGSPFPAGDAAFFSPNVSIVGTGTIHGSAGSFKMCATKVTPDADYTENRSVVTIGSLTIGDTYTSTHMDGSIEMRLFDGDFGDKNANLGGCCYMINPFILHHHSSLSGHLLLDASVKTRGTVSGETAIIYMDSLTINGTITGKVNDTYGICASFNSWPNSNSYMSAISIGGDIIANSECAGNYIGLLIDAPISQLDVAEITISGNIDATTENIADENVRIGVLTHASHFASNPCYVLESGSTIKGKDAAVVFDGFGDDALDVPISLDNATLQSSKVAIGGRNANFRFIQSPTLVVASMAKFAIAPCVPTYEYGNGTTEVTALETFSYAAGADEKFSSVDADNLALLRGSNLSIQLNGTGSLDATGMDIAVTGLNLGESNDIKCKTLFLAGLAQFGNSTSLHIPNGIIFCPDASNNESRAASKLSINHAENVLGTVSAEGVPKIDASFAAVGDDTNSYGAIIDISTENSSSAILPEGISGNLSDEADFTTPMADRYVTVALKGAGGCIGSDGVATSGISNVGKLIVNGANNESIWTIHGNTSCGTLRIEKGKMVQKGNLTVWGDLLLLGCDIDWTGNALFNHVYAGEDKITVRNGATVKISNGFQAANVGNDNPILGNAQLKTEAILLGGDSQFIVEPNTTVSIGIAGCDESKFGTADEPVGIRVVGNSLTLGEAPRQWPKDGQVIGNGNVINLQNSLNLYYYAIDGSKIAPASNKKTTAIRGNETTQLFLNGGTQTHANQLNGAISNVGHVTVNGYWEVPSGLDECGHLTIGPAGQLKCMGDADVNTTLITFCLDTPRVPPEVNFDKVPYLICKRLHNIYMGDDVRVCFNLELAEGLLSSSDEFTVCLVSGLTSTPQWMCGTRINGIKPIINFADGNLTATIPGTIGGGTRTVEFTAPNEYVLRNFWERGLLIPYSVHQANVTRKQNDLFRHALGLENGNFANADGKNWHLTRTSYASFLRRNRTGPIIDAVSANTTGSTIGVERNLPNGHRLSVAADYAMSHAHFRVWNNSKSYRCRMKGYGLGSIGQFVAGPAHFGLSAIANENCHRYGHNAGRLANVRFNGYSYNLAGNLSYDLKYGNWIVSPRLESNFDNVYHKNYAIDNGNMGISPCRTKFFQGVLGACVNMRKETWQFIGDLSLCHDFRLSGGFSTATSSENNYTILPAYFRTRDRIDGKFQVSVPWRKSWEFALNCDVTLQRHSWSGAATLGSIYHF